MQKWLFHYLILNLLAFTLPDSYTVSFLKLGNLFSHFHDHQHESDEHNVFEFLISHYFSKQLHSSAHQDHEELPFQHDHAGCLNMGAQLPSLMPQCCFLLDDTKSTHHSDGLIVKPQRWVTSSYIGDIWQPPKA